jgi:RNA polymerase sigma-70 factor (ECF subfamily)
MDEESDFKELIRRVRAGDSDAAADLVRRYEPAIRRAARVRLLDRRLRRVFDSMDICQSVLASFFVRMALGQYDVDKPAQLLRLLVSMSQKKLVDRARHQGAARRDYRRSPATAADVSQIAVMQSSPSQVVVAKELLEEFRKRLTDEERELADARALGKDWEQIAQERGVSAEALRKKLTRAVKRVGGSLGLEGFDDA